jgi:hypothetical protein
LRPVASYRLAVMWLELCLLLRTDWLWCDWNCAAATFSVKQGCKQFLFSSFVFSCLYFLPSSPLSLSPLRIVISLPLSQERLRPTFIQSLSFIAVPSTATYRTENLHPPGYPVAAAVLRTAIKETPRTSNIIALYTHSRLIISLYIVGILKKSIKIHTYSFVTIKFTVNHVGWVTNYLAVLSRLLHRWTDWSRNGPAWSSFYFNES